MDEAEGRKAETRWAAPLAGLAAAAAWWGANALHVFLTFDNKVPGSFAALALPAPVPGWRWVAAQPWPVLVPLLGALLVGVLVAAGVRALGRTGRPRFLTVWFVALAASAVAGVLLAVGDLAYSWPPPRARALLSGFPTVVEPAVLWGLVWGWLPALAASRSRAGAPASGRAPLAWTGAGVLLAAALVVSAGVTTRATPSAAPTPSPTPTVRPVPLVAPDAPAADTQWCAGDQVEVGLGGVDGATGHRILTVTATNRSGVDCTLHGYPDVAFGGDGNGVLRVHLLRGSSFLAKDPGPADVVLHPGGEAVAHLGWDAQAASDDTAQFLNLAAYPGLDRAQLPIDVDITADTNLAVTAWEPAR